MRRDHQPLVSIVIPAYNAARWLDATLQSAVAQTWTNMQVVLVDDGSTDGTRDIARRYGADVEVIAAPHRGQDATLNTALAAARGSYIQLLDADDVIAPDKIEIQVGRLLAEAPTAVATGPWARFYGENHLEAEFTDAPNYRDFDEPLEWLVYAFTHRGDMPPIAWLFPRVVLDMAGPRNEALCLFNDTEHFTRVVLASEKIVYTPGARSYYRSGHPSVSRWRTRAAYESTFHACELCTQHLLAVEDSARTRWASATLFSTFVYRTYPDALDLVERAERRIAELGGTGALPDGGRAFRAIRDIIGWKPAMRLQRAYYRLRYR